MNPARDALARSDVLTSGWDGRRGFGDLSRPLGEPVRRLGDRLAAEWS